MQPCTLLHGADDKEDSTKIEIALIIWVEIKVAWRERPAACTINARTSTADIVIRMANRDARRWARRTGFVFSFIFMTMYISKTAIVDREILEDDNLIISSFIF